MPDIGCVTKMRPDTGRQPAVLRVPVARTSPVGGTDRSPEPRWQGRGAGQVQGGGRRRAGLTKAADRAGG